MNMRKTIVLITAIVVVAALVATGSAIIINQNANKATNPGTSPGTTKGISIDQAATAAQAYLTRMGYPNLGIKMMQMTWLRGTPTTNMAVTMEQARTYAQQYLDGNYTGATVGQVTTFYGYHTMQVMKNGNVFGMIGV